MFLSNETLSMIDKINIVCSIANVVIVLFGAMFAVFQFLRINDRGNYERAYNLTKYYKDNIISNASAIIKLYKEVGIYKIFESIKHNEMEMFDQTELNELMKPSDIKKIENIEKNQKYVNKIKYVSKYFKLNIDCNDKELAKFSFKSFKIELLNSLEYFAMNFKNNKIAKEKYVYDTLGKIYISAVKCLYYDIAKDNERGGYNNLFKNTIGLYKKWSKRKLKQQIKSKKINK